MVHRKTIFSLPLPPKSRRVVNKTVDDEAAVSVAWQTAMNMASAVPLCILLTILPWTSALTSTESPSEGTSLFASPVPAPPLAEVRTTPSPPGLPLGLPPGPTPNSSLAIPERDAKGIRFSSSSGNEVDSVLSPEDELGVAAEVGGLSDPAAENETNPITAFKGVVSECLWALSVACLQRKILIFVNRLSRKDRFSLLGDGVALVRVWGDAPAAISEDILAERVSSISSADSVNDSDVGPDEEHLLDSLTQRALDDLIYSHAIRLRLPSWIGSYTGARSISAVDVDLDDLIETGRQGRKGIKIKIKKKKKKGGGKQMMKKMMKGMAKMGGMMMTMLLGKVAILAPFLKIISALALKASALALFLSKILLVRSLFSSGFGGGSGLTSIFSGLKGSLGGGGSTPSSGYGAPSSSYGAPQQQPSSSYGAPSSSYNAPSSSYGTPSASRPSSSYGAPSSSYGTPSASRPSSSYGAPSSSYGAPSSSFGAPSSSYSSPSSSYGAPSSSYSSPSSSYGAPSSSWSSGPTAPPAAPSSSYGTPAAQNSYAPPSKDYGAPSGGGGSWSSGGGYSSTGAGGGGSAGTSSSSGSSSGSNSGGGGYIGGGAQWSNRRGWEPYSVEATTEFVDQYNQ